MRVTRWPKYENLHPEFISSDHSVAFTGGGIVFTIYNFEQFLTVQYECDITRVFYQQVSQLAHAKT